MYEMKESGIEWIGQIPKHWEVRKVKYITKIYTGNSISDKDKSKYNDDYLALPYISTKHIDLFTSIISYKTDIYTKIEDNKFKVAYTNSILLCIEGGSAGKKVGYINRNVSFVNKLCCFYPYQQNKFLFYYIKSPAFIDEFTRKISGLIGGVSIAILKNFSIPFPPLDEQKKIADFLDNKVTEIDNLIDDTKKLIDKYKEYKQSLITETVTKGLHSNVEMKNSGIEWIGQIPKHWEVQKIKSIGNIRNGLTYHPENMVDENNGILVLRSSNIKDGELVFDDKVYVNLSIKKSLLVKKGNILLCSRNGSKELVGKNVIIEKNIYATFGAFMLLLNIKPNIVPKYIYYILNSCIFDYYLGSFLTTTINQLTNRNFNNIHIVFCQNYSEQEEIVKYLDDKCSQIDSIIEEKQLLIEKLEEYKKSLIYEYVTGKKQV